MDKQTWRLFRKRGPVNFMTPRARCCKLNAIVISALTKEEATELLAAFGRKERWNQLCDKIERRFLDEKIMGD